MRLLGGASLARRTVYGTLGSMYATLTSVSANTSFSGSIFGGTTGSIFTNAGGNATNYVSFNMSSLTYSGSFPSAGSYTFQLIEENPSYYASPKVHTISFFASNPQVTLTGLSSGLPGSMTAGQTYYGNISGGKSGSSYGWGGDGSGTLGISISGTSISATVYGGGNQGQYYSYTIYEYNSNATNSGRGSGFSFYYSY